MFFWTWGIRAVSVIKNSSQIKSSIACLLKDSPSMSSQSLEVGSGGGSVCLFFLPLSASCIYLLDAPGLGSKEGLEVEELFFKINLVGVSLQKPSA